MQPSWSRMGRAEDFSSTSRFMCHSEAATTGAWAIDATRLQAGYGAIGGRRGAARYVEAARDMIRIEVEVERARDRRTRLRHQDGGTPGLPAGRVPSSLEPPPSPPYPAPP